MTLSDFKEALATAGMVLAGTFTVLSPWVIAWLSKTFASKTKVDELAGQVAAMEQRLARGETRFVELEGAIKAATHAAREAKEAAEETAEAAKKVHGAEVTIARLEEKISGLAENLENIEHFTRLMVEGHMRIGGKS
ncbi:hypothetical protein [Magnetospirillum fulvum]|uniref:Methyl-accepting chemotaxis protein n=1 Tax=Magnetospirillum fulvum MGU-K5 TaxID=1316936 RepID=S9S879_MAGFU|nr:hypothetical protein [Magnetospirillum fulvum]EPY00869.1 hypothetical protein K678_13915 [Magnetospirillum fulvum MGU-K5]